MASISFDKEGLASAAAKFGELQETIKADISTILSSLEIIDSNWSGPEHDSAKTDKDKAEDCLNKAGQTIDNMNGAIEKLAINASKVSYNG